MIDLPSAETSMQPTMVVHLPADMDYAATSQLRSLLSPVLMDHEPSVVVDLSRVSFMDCAGLGVLLQVNASSLGRMRLVNCPPLVSEFLLLTGTYGSFDWLERPSGNPGPDY